MTTASSPSGTFTSEDVIDGELQLTFDKGAVRKDQTVLLKVTCPQGARLAALAKGANDASFGRLYVNNQSMQYNLAMAVGINAANAADVQSDNDGRDALEIGAYPVPFGESLSITIRGVVKAGATLQLLNHVGMPERVISLAGGQLDAPIRFTDLDQPAPRSLHHPPDQRRQGVQQAHPQGLKNFLTIPTERGCFRKEAALLHSRRAVGRAEEVEDGLDRGKRPGIDLHEHRIPPAHGPVPQSRMLQPLQRLAGK